MGRRCHRPDLYSPGRMIAARASASGKSLAKGWRTIPPRCTKRRTVVALHHAAETALDPPCHSRLQRGAPEVDRKVLTGAPRSATAPRTDLHARLRRRGRDEEEHEHGERGDGKHEECCADSARQGPHLLETHRQKRESTGWRRVRECPERGVFHTTRRCSQERRLVVSHRFRRAIRVGGLR